MDGALKEIRKLIYMDRPRQTEHRLSLAKVLAEKGEVTEAKTEVINLLETVPHFWAAQELLLEIVEKESR